MSYARSQVRVGGVVQDMRQGFGFLSALTPFIQALDSNQVITAAAIAGGLYQRTAITAGRTDTTDTAVNILANWPEMDIGDTFLLAVSVVPAFAVTYAAGTGVTLAGKATTPASGFNNVLITKTGAATLNWNVL